MINHLANDLGSVSDPAIKNGTLTVLIFMILLNMPWIIVQRQILLSQSRKHIMDEKLFCLFAAFDHLLLHKQVKCTLLLAFLTISFIIFRVVRDAICM